MAKDLILHRGNALCVPNFAAPIENIEAYIKYAFSIPVLSVEEEQHLACQLKEHNDIQAASKLILAHLRFVVKIAKGFNGYGLQLADLIQEGNIGLMKAVKRFDPSQGVRLVSFAVHWIKAEMQEFIIKNWRIVKVATTKAQRKLFFNLRQSKKRFGWMNQEEVKDIADTLKVSTKDVMEMETRLNAAYDVQFDGTVESDNEDAVNFSPSQYLSAPEAYNPDKAVESANTSDREQDLLAEGLKQLEPRALAIIKARYLNNGEKKVTLSALAKEHKVSIERVRQIEAQALLTLKKVVRN